MIRPSPPFPFEMYGTVDTSRNEKGGNYGALQSSPVSPSTPKRRSRGPPYILIFVAFCLATIVIVMFMMVERRIHDAEVPPPICGHPIYCDGPLLRAVQERRVFSDGKTFVDMPSKVPPSVVMQRFRQLNLQTDNLTAFVLQNFDPPGSELVEHTPTDFVDEPAFLASVKDAALRDFARNVHHNWKQLVREVNNSKYCAECTSLLKVQHPFVVPGGRFREFYYWDSFWTMKGMLVSGMLNTSRMLLENMLAIVDEYGFVPNGARLYYLDRSQLPVLTMMVSDYFNRTGDVAFLKRALPTLDKEYNQFTSRHRAPSLEGLHRYYVDVATPRPESYREDVEVLNKATPRSARAVYSSIAAGAESGMDFSTRWFVAGSFNMTTIHTMEVVPVDLNAVLLRTEELLSHYHREVGNAAQADTYQRAGTRRRDALWKHLWSEKQCAFLDFDTLTGKLDTRWFITRFAPLFVPSVAAALTAEQRACVVRSSELHMLPGGIPTSLENSGQQWDYPNAWAPLEWFVMEALKNVATQQSLADLDALATRWVQSNYCGYQNYHYMLEKYSAETLGHAGSGGEYAIQAGFGWSNGVVLQLLAERGATLAAPPSCPSLAPTI